MTTYLAISNNHLL